MHTHAPTMKRFIRMQLTRTHSIYGPLRRKINSNDGDKFDTKQRCTPRTCAQLCQITLAFIFGTKIEKFPIRRSESSKKIPNATENHNKRKSICSLGTLWRPRTLQLGVVCLHITKQSDKGMNKLWCLAARGPILCRRLLLLLLFMNVCCVCVRFVSVQYGTVVLPDTCEKHWVSVVTTNPDANAVANRTDETVAPTPAPAAAPHTMNTYRNDAISSANIDLESRSER